MTQANVVLEEIHRSGGHAAGCHAQMYTMGALLKHGSEEQKQEYLPGIARGIFAFSPFRLLSHKQDPILLPLKPKL
ncbi:acyl-CoA dehydrogenase family protein [Geomicrobium sp. JCM 19037]|uniref:acyl-CoA dehydrogenase family protein n=1 Tax=Geomicrobium sp. JCM 19037 TaxID=1460634 RepID=UPI001EE68A2D|nr:acyl-CoA dehydrogenase family protein [Geomicrobium sp. JCM 19037]